MSRLQKLVRKAANRFTDLNVVVLKTRGVSASDPNDESTYAPGEEARLLVPALVTYAAGAQFQQRAFLEENQCDIVLDFFPEADLSGDNVRFLVNGEEFAQRQLGKDISEFFTQAGRETIFRTVLGRFTGRAEGRVRYVSTRERIDLYHYDLQERRWSWINETKLAGRASIAIDETAAPVRMTIEDTLALRFADGVVEVGEMVATARPDTATLPRLEFYVGQGLIASLAKPGQLNVRAFMEAESDPNLRNDLEFRNDGGWLFSLADSGVHAPAIDDVL